jgi:flagellar basal body-associated protein FliL
LVVGVGTVGVSTYLLQQALISDRTFDISLADEDSPDEAAPAGAGDGEGQPSAESPARNGASSPNAGSAILSMEQIFANVLDVNRQTHSLMLKLDLELFDEANRALVDERSGVLKSIVIETAAAQTFETLNTLAGKVYFKEMLVSRMNEALQAPAVREIHFNSFYMQ